MAKRNKKISEEFDEEEFDEEEFDEEEFDEDESESTSSNNQVIEEYIENPLHLAGKIHAQSELYKQFPHLSPDVKIAFFDKFDKINFRYKSSAYQTYQYVQKINTLASLELKSALLLKKELYNCKNYNDFYEYFKKCKKTSLFLNVKEYSDELEEPKYSKISFIGKILRKKPKLIIQDLDNDVELNNNNNNNDIIFKSKRDIIVEKLVFQLENIKDSGLIDEIFGTKEEFDKIYKEYVNKKGEMSKLVDDIGLMNDMATNTESSKAYQGKERNALNTTINISREVNAEEDAEETPEQYEGGGQGFKKFFRGKK